MKKYDDVWNSLNNLLTMLRSFDVPKLVDQYYLEIYKNSAPGECLREQIKDLEKLMDEAEKE